MSTHNSEEKSSSSFMELRIVYFPKEKYNQLKTMAKNHGVPLASYVKTLLIGIINNTPDNQKIDKDELLKR